jgi:DNA-binding NarL/FixJ family response regulator
MSNKSSVIVADNQILTRNGIITLLKENKAIARVEEVSNKDELVFQLKKGNFSVLIIDFDYFDLSDINELKEIKKVAPFTCILIISNNNNPDDIISVLNFGISNYILKNCDINEFSQAINAALINRRYFCSEVLDILVEQKTVQKKIEETSNLTLAEIEIVKMISQGLTTKEIAQKKYLSFHTINTHRKNIFKKLGIKNTSELLMYSVRKGIVNTTEYYI